MTAGRIEATLFAALAWVSGRHMGLFSVQSRTHTAWAFAMTDMLEVTLFAP